MSMPMHELGLGLWQQHAATWMLATSWIGLLAFGLPMMLWPLAWARLLGWSTTPHDLLAIYFGRCLGMVASAVSMVGIVAVNHANLWPMFFNLGMLIYAANTLVHLWGAVRRIQPASESWETLYWLGLLVLQVLFYPGAHWRWV